MLPKYHFYIGLITSIVVYFISGFTNALLFFIGSFLIDTDHYIAFVFKEKNWSLMKSYFYWKYLNYPYDELMIFHTIEIWILLLIIGLLINPVLFMLAGMLYHELFDIYDMHKRKLFNARAISLFAWATRNLK
ncbi:hypothetical protein J4455_04985 [Candidatus Woesearchaeota archaeon]|nr:hypothetical protein [Candidatus Woesearchaeota archaeon]